MNLPLNILIKPASSSCNLACTYCFYNDVSSNRGIKNHGYMTAETSEILIEKSLCEPSAYVSFVFQGGEPTLCGLDFYERFVELVKKYNKKNRRVIYALQTNGVLIGDLWAAFLRKNNFLTGISLDGYKELHNLNRFNYHGEGSFANVMKAITVMNKHGAEYNILTVVNNNTAKHVDKLYNFFKKNNFKYLQFIPCIDDFSTRKGSKLFSLSTEGYEEFLKRLFDRWYIDCVNGQGVSIRNFDNWLGLMRGYPPESCAMQGVCSCSFTIESDGSVYPCDFYVLDQWKLGNVRDNSFSEMRSSERVLEFIRKSKSLPQKCTKCRYLILCRNGCMRDRELVINDEVWLNYYCRAYERFFDYSIDRFHRMFS